MEDLRDRWDRTRRRRLKPGVRSVVDRAKPPVAARPATRAQVAPTVPVEVASVEAEAAPERLATAPLSAAPWAATDDVPLEVEPEAEAADPEPEAVEPVGHDLSSCIDPSAHRDQARGLRAHVDGLASLFQVLAGRGGPLCDHPADLGADRHGAIFRR